MSPLRKQAIFTKRVILDEIFVSRNSVMLEYQLIEKGGNIDKRNFFGFECFRSGLIFYNCYKYSSPLFNLTSLTMVRICFSFPLLQISNEFPLSAIK